MDDEFLNVLGYSLTVVVRSWVRVLEEVRHDEAKGRFLDKLSSWRSLENEH